MEVFEVGAKHFDFSKSPVVMGILNVTPDSFSDGGKWTQVAMALSHAIHMEKAGASIIDIGAQSTRPGHERISPEEEIRRLGPVFREITKVISVPISIDTFYPEVARFALEHGAGIINDITGFENPEMACLAAQKECSCVVMHSHSLTVPAQEFFQKQLDGLLLAGVKSSRICFDPGLGFNKTYEENLEILRSLDKYRLKDFPVLVGASRKSFIGKACGEEEPHKRIAGSIAAHLLALQAGANILRVHDVYDTVQAMKVARAILGAGIEG